MKERTQKGNAALTKFEMDEIVYQCCHAIAEEGSKKDQSDDGVAELVIRFKLHNVRHISSEHCCSERTHI